MKSFTLMLFLIGCMLLVAACGGDSAPTDADNNANDTSESSSNNTDTQASSDLSLSEGQYYIIQSSGAINYNIVADSWGGDLPNRRLYEDGSQNEYWSLRLGGSNKVDTPAISLINLEILKGIEPGTYPLTEGGLLSSPDADEPVQVMAFAIRYPDFETLNDEEEFNGTLTIESISDEGMRGSIDVTLFGEGGEVQVNAVFDVPVVEKLEA